MTLHILLKAFFQCFEKLVTLFLREGGSGHSLAPEMARGPWVSSAAAPALVSNDNESLGAHPNSPRRAALDS